MIPPVAGRTCGESIAAGESPLNPPKTSWEPKGREGRGQANLCSREILREILGRGVHRSFISRSEVLLFFGCGNSCGYGYQLQLRQWGQMICRLGPRLPLLLSLRDWENSGSTLCLGVVCLALEIVLLERYVGDDRPEKQVRTTGT